MCVLCVHVCVHSTTLACLVEDLLTGAQQRLDRALKAREPSVFIADDLRPGRRYRVMLTLGDEVGVSPRVCLCCAAKAVCDCMCV